MSVLKILWKTENCMKKKELNENLENTRWRINRFVEQECEPSSAVGSGRGFVLTVEIQDLV